jgi:hypothetical protein
VKKTRLVLLAALALPAMAAAQDRGTPHASLPAFRSDRELARFLEEVERLPERPVPPAPPRPPRAVYVQPVCTAPPPGPPPAEDRPGEPAQAPAVITGRVANERGCPVADVLVRIERLNVGALTGADGTYRLVVPAALTGVAARVTPSDHRLEPASRPVTLWPGARRTVNFQVKTRWMLYEDVVLVPDESITNNQHAGVDEGGIVKRHGDYLVILRRGRLFTVAVGGGGLRAVSMVNAFPPGSDPDGWYDEMLVSGDNVLVIGYSYDLGGTEINLFRIDREGRLHYAETYHLRSDDYYSPRNYTSRLIGTRLVMYAPIDARAYYADVDEWMPAMRRWHTGAGEDEFRRILRPEHIYRSGLPLHYRDDVTLHSVTRCELGRGRPRCEATAVLGPEGRVFYVSPTAVYVWTSDWAKEEGRAPSTVYRVPLDGSPPAALGVEGSPVSHLSFLESDDGHLNVVTHSHAEGDGMWNAMFNGGDVRLLRVPIRHFGNGGSVAPEGSYRTLPAPRDSGYAFHTRFVGRHLLYGVGSGWGYAGSTPGTLYAVPWSGGGVTELPLPHGVDRVEVMGPGAVVVGTDATDLHFTGIRLDGTPHAVQRHVHPGAQQGEERSHGFFYRADAPDQGVIGLPIKGPGELAYGHVFGESAAVLFVENRGASFRALGELGSSSASTEDDTDGCIASCVDWYGNSRPIFIGDRILALMGYEIVEGAVVDGRIREVRRISFAPPPAPVATKP